MIELRDEAFERALADCPGCVLDYVLIQNETPYRGLGSHREAVAFAFHVLGERFGGAFTFDARRMAARGCRVRELLSLPDAPWKEERFGVTSFNIPRPLPYWFAFLEPPHGAGCGPEAFQRVNAALFPEGEAGLEAFRWNDGFSDYFDDGKEWWGTGLWSVYDRALDRFTIIAASATD